MKLKKLKEEIYQKIGGEHKPDRLKLSLEGEVLEKGQKTLAKYELKHGTVLQLEFSEKPIKEPRLTG